MEIKSADQIACLNPVEGFDLSDTHIYCIPLIRNVANRDYKDMNTTTSQIKDSSVNMTSGGDEDIVLEAWNFSSPPR